MRYVAVMMMMMMMICAFVRLFVGLTEGLMHFHEQGFVHGDMKPDNVFVNVGNGGRWMIGDFGIAGGS